MLKISALFFFASLLFTACGPSNAEKLPGTSSANEKRYEFRGKIVSVDRADKTAKIHHEAIPGYMEAMTMDFPIKEDWVWDNLVPGSDITAELVVDNTQDPSYWLEGIAIVAAPDPNAPAPAVRTPDEIGKQVPDTKLTDQDGRQFSLRDLKGKSVAVTFIYARCPLPDYCIKMSKNFSDLAIRLNKDTENRDRIRLVSVSFDPANDTPAKLRQYGIGYLGNPAKPDFTVWRLAVGKEADIRQLADFFGLRYSVDETNRTQIDHTLVTAVIDPNGIVKDVVTGNRWTPDDLLAKLEAAE